MLVGDGHDDLPGSFLAQLVLTLFLQETESKGGLCRRSRLGDIDDTELLSFQVSCQLSKIILTDIVSCKEDSRILLVIDKPCEAVSQGLDDGTGTEVRTADTCNDNHLTLLTERIGYCLNLTEELRRDARRQMQPSEEVIARASSLLQRFLCGSYMRSISLYCARIQELGGF